MYAVNLKNLIDIACLLGYILILDRKSSTDWVTCRRHMRRRQFTRSANSLSTRVVLPPYSIVICPSFSLKLRSHVKSSALAIPSSKR